MTETCMFGISGIGIWSLFGICLPAACLPVGRVSRVLGNWNLIKRRSEMMCKYLYGLLGLSVLLSGCVVRTYPLTRDRVDQDLSTGNRGYLQGTAPAAPERKSKRTTRVVEIELSSPIKIDKRSREEVVEPSSTTAASDKQQWSEGNQGYMTQSLVPVMKKPSQMTFEKYTVQKGDTLQKISQKYFGTTKKWLKIYEANKNTLKGPDRIYEGQVLNIPVDLKLERGTGSSKEYPKDIK